MFPCDRLITLACRAPAQHPGSAAPSGAAYQGLADGYRDFQMLLAEDPERFEIFRRWWSEPTGDTLTAREDLQVHGILLALFRNFESTQRQLRVGLISEEDAIAFFGFSFVRSRAFARWWSEHKGRYSGDFVRFMEESILP